MYNWKLNAFFIIGLMLIAGVFSNAAMAARNDGRGEVEVAWGFQDLTDLKIVTVSEMDTPLGAGSTHNILKFTYTAEDDGTPINMSGGRVRIVFPRDWKVSNKLIRVSDGTDLGPGDDGVIYETNNMGELNTDIFDDGDKRADANAKVTFEPDRHITINLGSQWGGGSREPSRELVIILSDVTVPIPSRLNEAGDDPDEPDELDSYSDNYHNFEFTVSSMARNGTLSRLAEKVNVRVGSILGDRDLVIDDNGNGVPDAFQTRDRLITRDPLIREFKVTPARVFLDEENIRFRITFEAPGPMYGFPLAITIPPALQTPDFDDDDIADGTIRITGRATIGNSTISGNVLTIPINRIDKDQSVAVSYDIETVTGDVGKVSAVTKSVPAKVTGGVASDIAGSGRMSISPAFVDAGAPRRDITLTYTAYTDFDTETPLTLVIRPEGIVINSDHPLQEEEPSKYGYVSGSEPSSNLTITDGDNAAATITWEGIEIRKNQTLRTTIRRVNILDAPGNYDWEVNVEDILLEDDETTDVNEEPILSVVSRERDAVDFAIDGEGVFPAAGRGTIIFKFAMDSTPIRNGRVSLTIPSALGTAPTTAEGKPGRVTATADSADALEADQPTVSGRTVNVAINRMEIGESVTVTYGDTTNDDGTTDDNQKAEFHYVANESVKVSGTFRVSSSASTRSAGSVPVRLENVMDGTGSATLSPTAVEAGSDNRAIEIVFTASGTMNGGAVSLEIPSDWGSMQDDPTRRNYLTTRGSAVSSLTVGSNTAIAEVRTLGRGGSIRFIYGGGTSRANNGVEVQDHTGIAQFTIKTDGDGDGIFAEVTSDVKHEGKEKVRNPKKVGRIYADAPGILQIEVTGAVDGTGTATVDPTEVRAAEAVRLVFTYRPGQTIEDGELRFTVPTGWSKPQVDDVGSPGYTELESVGLGTPTANRSSVTVPIFFLDRSQTITITYGATDAGLAVVSAATGTDSFRIEVQGHEGGKLQAIRRQPTVTVRGQASGEGKAVLTVNSVGGDTSLYAGDTRRQITITYTAAGQIVDGRVRLTIPFDWSRPTASTVTVRPAIAARYDGQLVIVEGVNLNANGRLTFIYTGDVQPRTAPDVKFGVEVHSGLSGDFFEEVTGEGTMLTVDVQEARPGSGSGTVSPTSVRPGATGVNLTFTYTAVGEIAAPREFRVQVPSSWPPPSEAETSSNNQGTYTVVHRHRGIETTTSVEKIGPFGRDMAARVRLGGLEVEAEDQIIFTYRNATAPATPEVSNFRMLFDGVRIRDSTQVRVGTVPPPPPDPTPPPPDPVIIILTATIDRSIARAGDTVTVTATGTARRRPTFTVGSVVPKVAMTEFPAGTYTGSFTVADDVHDGVHAVTVNLGDSRQMAGTLTVDTVEPTVQVTVSPDTVANGDTITITATVSEAATSVTADVSVLDTTQTAPIPLTLSNGTYSGSFTISDDNQADSGRQTITVTAIDAAGNSGAGSATVMLTSTLEYTSMIPAGTSLFHVPLDVENLDTVGDLKTMLGGAASLLIVYDYATRSWNSRSDSVPITADLGIVLSMRARKTVVFRGDAWGDGTSEIRLQVGTNLIGLPVNSPRVQNVSDIIGLFDKGIVSNIIVSTGAGQFGTVGRVGDPADGPVMGDAAYLVIAGASATTTITVTGTGWRNGGMGRAAPIALAGYNVEGQTPVLDVQGAVVDEITGLAREGFRVKVKNLSTKASLNRVTSLPGLGLSDEMEAGGYNMTFVDLKSGNAARIGDVLEISADSPDPLIGVQPVRHIVTANDVKNNQIQLEDLIAYEIPAETELLRNYPNPFNPETWIPYRLAEDADVSLTIYDSNGELVRSINVGHQIAAVYESRAKAIYWDGRNRFGEQVASGIYFYSLNAGDFSATRKMVILK